MIPIKKNFYCGLQPSWPSIWMTTVIEPLVAEESMSSWVKGFKFNMQVKMRHNLFRSLDHGWIKNWVVKYWGCNPGIWVSTSPISGEYVLTTFPRYRRKTVFFALVWNFFFLYSQMPTLLIVNPLPTTWGSVQKIWQPQHHSHVL